VSEVRACHGELEQPLRTPREDLALFGVSELAPSASWVCYVPALQPGDVSKVALVVKLSLLLIAVFAVMFLHERPTMQEWVGVLLVGAGVLIPGLKR
jgi:bacterial/archaeal transporter family protein